MASKTSACDYFSLCIIIKLVCYRWDVRQCCRGKAWGRKVEEREEAVLCIVTRAFFFLLPLKRLHSLSCVIPTFFLDFSPTQLSFHPLSYACSHVLLPNLFNMWGPHVLLTNLLNIWWYRVIFFSLPSNHS